MKNSVGAKSLKTTKDWLSGEETYTLHKPVRYKFDRRRTLVSGPFKQFQADLLDTLAYSSENDCVKFLLNVIDVFSKYVCVRALQSEATAGVTKAFENIVNSIGEKCKPRYLQMDEVGEFVSNTFQDYLKRRV